MPRIRRRLLPLVALLLLPALHAAPAAASTTQEAILQDDGQLKSNPAGTLATLQDLGVTRVRVGLEWDSVAPATCSTRKPRHFNASDPKAYGSAFAIYDAIDRQAVADHISVYFMLTGPAPRWAVGRGAPRGCAYSTARIWRPSASEFGQFVHAVGERYNGKFAHGTLPAVRFWSIWNEPNYGNDLAPQATAGDSIELSPAIYRGLLSAGWGGLLGSGHTTRTDTILIGETAPRGLDHPIGNFGGIKPLRFLRALYCVDSRFRPLRGFAASARGCPTTAAGSRAFRRSNPALFAASGFAAHLYTSQSHPGPPTQNLFDPDYADLPNVGRLEATLDRANRVYGSRTRFRIWNTEYAYRTRPPDRHAGVSLANAALYINWAEYLSWRQPRLMNFMQYLLVDPPIDVFTSGLEYANGRKKPDYWAFRVPIYLPVTSTRHGRSIEVWGAARPAHEYSGTHYLFIQFHGRHGGWTALKTLVVRNSRGYIDVRMQFPSSGFVRLAWTPPGLPTEHSRSVQITVR